MLPHRKLLFKHFHFKEILSPNKPKRNWDVVKSEPFLLVSSFIIFHWYWAIFIWPPGVSHGPDTILSQCSQTTLPFQILQTTDLWRQERAAPTSAPRSCGSLCRRGASPAPGPPWSPVSSWSAPPPPPPGPRPRRPRRSPARSPSQRTSSTPECQVGENNTVLAIIFWPPLTPDFLWDLKV